jgi:hypothetical protein
MMKETKIYSFINFEIHNTLLLTLVTTLHTSNMNSFCLTETLSPSPTFPHFLLIHPQMLFITIWISISTTTTFKNSTFEIIQHLSFCVWIIFIVMLGGGTLWCLQKFLHYVKYIIVEFTPSTILLYSSPPFLE